MGAGHASTSIGYAVGLKEAMRHGVGTPGRVAAVIGDGAMTGGVAFEAIHQAGGLGTPLVVVLNDNGMSISPNVGALSRYFNRVRLEPKMWRAREGVEEKLTKLPAGIGAAFERLGPQLKESIKAFTSPGLLWEELDWAYMGVIDGHDVRRAARRAAPRLRGRAPRRRPRRHRQGQGLRARRGGRPRGHGEVARRQAEVDRQAHAGARRAQAEGRQARAAAVHAGVRRGARARVPPRRARDRHHRGDELRHRPLDPPEGAARALLRRRHRRAAGGPVRLRPRLQGARPVVAIYSTFLQRAYDQIVHDVCLQSLPVVVLHGPRRARRRRRPDPPRRVRHRLPALPAEHHADGAARRGDARPHAPHRAAPRRRPGRHPLPARRGRRRRAPGPAAADRDRHRRDPPRGRARGDPRLRHRRRQGARRRRHPRRGRASTSPSPTRASPSRSTPACSPSWRPSTTCS